jgi:hypothetical protein
MRWIYCALTILAFSASALADDIKVDDLKKLYNDTLSQLKTAQDRKAELAAQNQKLETQTEKLTARVAELEKQTQQQTAQIKTLRLETGILTDDSLFFRSHYLYWIEFVTGNPDIGGRWDSFISTLAPVGIATSPPNLIDREWPWSARG